MDIFYSGLFVVISASLLIRYLLQQKMHVRFDLPLIHKWLLKVTIFLSFSLSCLIAYWLLLIPVTLDLLGILIFICITLPILWLMISALYFQIRLLCNTSITNVRFSKGISRFAVVSGWFIFAQILFTALSIVAVYFSEGNREDVPLMVNLKYDEIANQDANGIEINTAMYQCVVNDKSLFLVRRSWTFGFTEYWFTNIGFHLGIRINDDVGIPASTLPLVLIDKIYGIYNQADCVILRSTLPSSPD